MAGGRKRLRKFAPRISYGSTFLGQPDPSASTSGTSSDFFDEINLNANYDPFKTSKSRDSVDPASALSLSANGNTTTTTSVAGVISSKHGTTYYKQLLEENKQHCSTRQLLYTRLASIRGRTESFWKEVDHVKGLWKNREIVGRGFTFTGYYPPLTLEETEQPPLTDASIDR
ncbi:hypothetical protein IGI04_013239 [Brassica rapa subsp. trilocularis]|uniref:Uncharacterized protein n=1 Tax=Brassica rapa subsp. trilocularis TaxID=1813537 RepID=A0ABQ7N8C1_BRACM|nr:hypothetical protein IGI04_013239 [Brassica rapa subsp. trilocularis]